MIQYEGNGQISILLSNGNTIHMTEDEIFEIYELASHYYNLCSDADENNTPEKIGKQSKRPYNSHKMKRALYDKYKTPLKTDAEVFRQIASELDISYKAVEKTFY